MRGKALRLRRGDEVIQFDQLPTAQAGHHALMIPGIHAIEFRAPHLAKAHSQFTAFADDIAESGRVFGQEYSVQSLRIGEQKLKNRLAARGQVVFAGCFLIHLVIHDRPRVQVCNLSFFR
jgi:hypothetical protein